MSLDFAQLMRCLVSKRPIFHSEADFQHALAWELHIGCPDIRVRLEVPHQVLDESQHLDLWLPDLKIAIELKYKTRPISVEYRREWFRLKDQSAQDTGRYDFLKDVERLERIVKISVGALGFAIFLSNDPLYWKPQRTSNTNDAAFQLFEGWSVAGTLDWASKASDGTKASRVKPIVLASKYESRWQDFSRVDSSSFGVFRYLAFSVGRTAESPQQ